MTEIITAIWWIYFGGLFIYASIKFLYYALLIILDKPGIPEYKKNWLYKFLKQFDPYYKRKK